MLGRQTLIASMSSGRLPPTVTWMGRVWGTGMGMLCTQVTSATPNRSIRPRTARVKRSHWKSGSYPVSSRKGRPISSRPCDRTRVDGV